MIPDTPEARYALAAFIEARGLESDTLAELEALRLASEAAAARLPNAFSGEYRREGLSAAEAAALAATGIPRRGLRESSAPAPAAASQAQPHRNAPTPHQIAPDRTETHPSAPEAHENAPDRTELHGIAPQRTSEEIPESGDKPLFALDNPRQEALCRGLAQGFSLRAAAKAAGYQVPRNCRRLLLRPEIIARVERLRVDAAFEASPDLSGLFAQLRRVSEAALSGDAPRTVSVARDCIELAAKLKGRVAEAAEASQILAPIVDERISNEEWERRHGPDAPR